MPSYFPPKKNTAYTCYISLISQANTKVMQSSPTLATGDFKVSIDGGTLTNLTTLPSVSPASSKMVVVSLSPSEMNGDNITIVCSDAAGAEWCDLVLNLQTTARQLDDLAYPATSGRSLAVDTSGQVTAGALANNAITAAAIAADAITAAKIADGAIDAATFAAGAINAAAIATDAIGAAELASDAVAEIQSGLMLAASYSAPDNTSITAIKAKTDNLPASPAATSDIPSAATNAAAVRSELTTELGRLDAAMTSRATPAQVNAEVVDALSVDTYAEPGAVPAATASLKEKIGWLFALATNKRLTTSTSDAVRNAGDTATIGTAALADDGTTFVRSKYS